MDWDDVISDTCYNYILCSCLNVGGLFVLCLVLQNRDSEDANCVGIDGVLKAYFESLRTAQLYGPTNFAPIINLVAQ